MKTEDLITLMAQDTRRPANLTLALSGAVAGGALIAGIVFFSMIGFRQDIAQAIETIRFPFKFIVTLSLFGAATSLVGPISRPGSRLGMRPWFLATAPILLLMATVVELIVTPSNIWLDKLVGQNALHCLTMVPMLSAFPGVFLFLAMRQGAPANPGLAGALAGLVSAGIAATLYASNCFDDSALFVVTWYSIATLTVVATGYFAGKRYLRW